MRYYSTAAGQLPSVTSILDATMPEDKRSQLDLWYANNPKALLINAESQRRGNAVDEWAKAYLSGGLLPEIDFSFNPLLVQLRPKLDALKAYPLLLNHQVVDLVRGYAGTLDLAYQEGDSLRDGKAERWVVADLKSKRFIAESAIDSAKLQVVAYAEALMLEGYNVAAVEVIAITPKRLVSYRVEFSSDEYGAISKGWAHRLRLFKGVAM